MEKVLVFDQKAMNALFVLVFWFGLLTNSLQAQLEGLWTFNSQNGTDSTGNNVSVANGFIPPAGFSTNTPNSGGFSFNTAGGVAGGTDFSVSAPSWSGITDNFSVGFWFNGAAPTASTDPNSFARIVAMGSDWEFVVNGFTTSNVAFDITGPGRTNFANLNGAWNHAAITYSGGNVVLYLNGAQAATASGATLANSGTFFIGERNGGSRSFDGFIDDVAIFSSVLTPAQINTIMGGDFCAFDSSLPGCPPMGSGGGTTGGGTTTTVTIPQFMNVIDMGAIDQLLGSAIRMNMAVGQIAGNVHNVGGRSLNQRIHRLRGRHTHEFQRENCIRRGREVSAARHFQSERELEITNSINLTGRTEASIPSVNSSSLNFDTAVINDGSAVLFPSVTQQAHHSTNPGVLASGSNWEVFASADFGQYDLDALGGSPGVESNTYASTAGIEYVINENWAVGAGWSHLWNDNTLAGGVGSADIEGDTAMFYTSYFKDNFWGDVFYSYGDYEAEIKRNALGSTMRATPDIEAHQTTLNLGYNIPVEDRFVHGPTFRADYSWGQLDGYTETGNAAFNTRFSEQEYESFITTLGWQLNWRHDTRWGAMRPTFRAGYGRENINQETNVSGSLQQSPFAQINTATGAIVGRGANVTRSLSQVDPGEGWMEFGAGVGLDFTNNFGLFFDYQGRFFQEDAQLHLGTVKASWRW